MTSIRLPKAFEKRISQEQQVSYDPFALCHAIAKRGPSTTDESSATSEEPIVISVSPKSAQSPAPRRKKKNASPGNLAPKGPITLPAVWPGRSMPLADILVHLSLEDKKKVVPLSKHPELEQNCSVRPRKYVISSSILTSMSDDEVQELQPPSLGLTPAQQARWYTQDFIETGIAVRALTLSEWDRQNGSPMDKDDKDVENEKGFKNATTKKGVKNATNKKGIKNAANVKGIKTATNEKGIKNAANEKVVTNAANEKVIENEKYNEVTPTVGVMTRKRCAEEAKLRAETCVNNSDGKEGEDKPCKKLKVR